MKIAINYMLLLVLCCENNIMLKAMNTQTNRSYEFNCALFNLPTYPSSASAAGAGAGARTAEECNEPTEGTTKKRKRDDTQSLENDAQSKKTCQKECCICLAIQRAQEKTTVLLCTHEFHEDCINQWFARQRLSRGPRSCPICRKAEGVLTLEQLKNAINTQNIEAIINSPNYGTTINLQDDQGNTPLHMCVLNAHVNKNIIDLLLERGADKSIRNHNGKTAYELAMEQRNPRATLKAFWIDPIRSNSQSLCIIQ